MAAIRAGFRQIYSYKVILKKIMGEYSLVIGEKINQLVTLFFANNS